MKQLFFFIFIVYSSLSFSQDKSIGIPFIKNYNIKEYKAGAENWAVVKDKRGVMYFGNNAGVLEYDGTNWNLIKLNKKTTVRTLAIDSVGIIYVGAENEFGFLQPDKTGKLLYISLSDSLPDTDKDFTEINSLFATDNEIYFCSKHKIYKYQNNQISVIKLKEGGFVSFYINDTLYNGNYYEGLLKLENDSLVKCKGGDFYTEKDIYGIIPYKNNQFIISTGEHTLYIYNKGTGLSKKPKSKYFSDLENLLKSSELYVNSVQKTKTGFLINTLWNGIILTDNNFKITENYNKKSGFQDETVVSSFFENDKHIEPIWLGMYNGISKIEINNPIRKIPDNYGIKGDVNDIIRFNNELYFATSSGVYKLQYNKETKKYRFNIIKETSQNQIWSLNIFNNNLLISGYYVYNLSKNDIAISEINNPTYKIINYNNSWYFASVIGFNEYTFDNNKFSIKNKTKLIKDEIKDIIKDSYNNLWLSSSKGELIRFCINKNDTIIEYFNKKENFKTAKHIYVFNYLKNTYVSTDTKLLRYNNKKNEFTQELNFNKEFYKILINIKSFITDKNGTIYISKIVDNFNEIIKIEQKDKDTFVIDRNTLKRIPQMQSLIIYPDKNGQIWISTTEGLFLYNANNKTKSNTKFTTLIRKVSREDTILFNGTYFIEGKIKIKQPESNKPTFTFKHNSLTFYFASPFFIEEQEIKFQTFLEGFDKTWSKPTKIPFKEYTNLNENTYTFKVKAINIYGDESEIAEYSFTILPPWYRSFWAFIVYFLIFIIIVWIIVKLNTMRLEKDKEHLEEIVKERTAEIIAQKTEIEEKNHHITSSIEYASRIQYALLTPNEIVSKYLPEHFILFKPRDIVSGDFYWLKQIGNHTIYAAADCTGHGVPGAFMSMLGISFLNEIVSKTRFDNAGEILDKLRKKVKASLRQTGKDNESKDGMDIAVCIINKETLIVEYAGAYNPLYIIRKRKLIEIKATRNPIGIYLNEESFKNHKFQLEKGDILYTFSDGYIDQFGGEDERKFKTKNFKNLLIEISDKPMHQQKETLEEILVKWRGNIEQTDDIIVFGVKI